MSARPVRTVDYYRGQYDTCRLLLTSPRFNRPQREVLEGVAYAAKQELEARGVVFAERPETPPTARGGAPRGRSGQVVQLNPGRTKR